MAEFKRWLRESAFGTVDFAPNEDLGRSAEGQDEVARECGVVRWLKSPSEIGDLTARWAGSPLDPSHSEHWYAQLAGMLKRGDPVGWSPAFDVSKINWRRSQKWTQGQLIDTANRVLVAKGRPTVGELSELRGSGDQFRGAIPPVVIQWWEGVLTPQDGNHRCGLAQVTGLNTVPAFVHVAML